MCLIHLWYAATGNKRRPPTRKEGGNVGSSLLSRFRTELTVTRSNSAISSTVKKSFCVIPISRCMQVYMNRYRGLAKSKNQKKTSGISGHVFLDKSINARQSLMFASSDV
jgi:hypothetical protein